MDRLRSDWVGVFGLLVVCFFLTYFGWISKTSRSIWAVNKTDPYNYNPGYGYVYWCRAASIGFGAIAILFIIVLLVSCKVNGEI